MKPSRIIAFAVLFAMTVWIGRCYFGVVRVTFVAAGTTLNAFEKNGDQARARRASRAGRALSYLAGARELTPEEMAPLKQVVADAKADAEVTLEEADAILAEMEQVLADHADVIQQHKDSVR